MLREDFCKDCVDEDDKFYVPFTTKEPSIGMAPFDWRVHIEIHEIRANRGGVLCLGDLPHISPGSIRYNKYG